MGSKTVVPSEVQQLTEKFGKAFDEPKGLPPPCSFDHKIQLQESSKRPCIRPYKYLYYQKEEIEHLVV